MSKTILITGATDGIGLETARRLAAQGHHLLIHGRSVAKLAAAQADLAAIAGAGPVEVFEADLSDLEAVNRLADQILNRAAPLDVLINNAGVFRVPAPVLPDGQDLRFVVNTMAPYLLTRRLWTLLGGAGRVVNLSSAAQAPVDLAALEGHAGPLEAMEAYAQSKLAITMWTRHVARDTGQAGPMVVAVNPGSLLASKMVREGFGVAGNDLSIGAAILIRAALSDDFAQASGQYFDNDAGRFAPPDPAGQDEAACAALVVSLNRMLARWL